MSTEANTYEELYIRNVNDQTAEICNLLGEYLIANWDVRSLKLTVDNKPYETENSVAEGSELYSVCKSLATAKEVQLAFRSCGRLHVHWRLESSFMKHFTDNPAVRENVSYRCAEYYDTDAGVSMYRYDTTGLQRIQYTSSADCVADIKAWYCYTPTFRIADEEQQGNAKLHANIMAVVTKLCDLLGLTEEDKEDRLDDDWEDYGEIVLSGSVRFATKDIPEIKELANQLVALLADSDSAEFEFEIYAVPDGEGDYDFASAAIAFNGTDITDKYCRF